MKKKEFKAPKVKIINIECKLDMLVSSDLEKVKNTDINVSGSKVGGNNGINYNNNMFNTEDAEEGDVIH